ncbi:proteasome ATPase [Kribbella yunnanensis]|uniref:Proteasome ATPase n=1 Tax=Kribbella yunnanensis TaxID=190194 RepID=A0ABN2J5A8_9ACTN
MELQNERLADALREARESILTLREEVDRLAQPPSGFGAFLGRHYDDTLDVFTGGRVLRVAASPSVDLDELKHGQLLMLNEALSVVEACDFEVVGDVVMLKEVLADGERALVIAHADEERVVRLASPLLDQVLRAGDSLLLESRSGYVYEKIPKSEVAELILEEVPAVGYDDIGGLRDQIGQLRDAIELPYLHRDLCRQLGVTPPKGVLLYGPPGCGKTLIAKAVANSLAKMVARKTGMEERTSLFLNIKGPELLNKYVGETERHIRLIFQRAREKASEGTPVIVFFDEMDSLFRTRGSGVSSDVENTIVPQLLSEIDGVERLENVVVIGATSREDMIDPAILRPGRLDVKIKIGRPDPEAARQILGKYLTMDLPYPGQDRGDGAIRRYRDDIVSQLVKAIYDNNSPAVQIAEVTFESGHKERVGFSRFISGAILREIVDRAKYACMKRLLDEGVFELRGADLLAALTLAVEQAKDLLNTSRFEDWAWISGEQGERIQFIRTLSPQGAPERAVVPDISRIKWG